MGDRDAVAAFVDSGAGRFGTLLAHVARMTEQWYDVSASTNRPRGRSTTRRTRTSRVS
jgi:hypothetical protein